VSSYCIADELGPVGAQARDDVLDVVDGEHDAPDTQRVHRAFTGPNLIASGVWLSSSIAARQESASSRA
jgi:hypothetical protein